MKIIFVRHGESESNVGLTKSEDSSLTKRGREQAKYLGIRLKEQNIYTIYTSKLLRARQTGEIISKIIRVPVKENLEELDEYPTKNLKSATSRVFNNRLRRLKKFLKKISEERDEDKTILIIAHGITNRIIMGYLLRMPLKKYLLHFWENNTGLNRVLWNKKFKNWRMDRTNDISHLPDRLVSEDLI
ncbi:MAG: histidine phosphatase family protein [Candidatus Nanoarchaeia archaeon]